MDIPNSINATQNVIDVIGIVGLVSGIVSVLSSSCFQEPEQSQGQARQTQQVAYDEHESCTLKETLAGLGAIPYPSNQLVPFG